MREDHRRAAVTLLAALAASLLIGAAVVGVLRWLVPSPVPVEHRLSAAADTWLDSAAPGAVHGADPGLRVGGSPPRHALVGFDLTGVTGTVTSARLRLHARSGDAAAIAVVTAAGTGAWAEAATTWATRPASTGPPAGVLDDVDGRGWHAVNVTAAVRAGAHVSFLLTADPLGDEPGTAVFDGREAGGLGPELVLTVRPPATADALAARTPGAVVVGAVGDTVCAPSWETTGSACRHRSVSDLVAGERTPDVLLLLGDTQYPDGDLDDYRAAYEPSYGRVKAVTRPAVGNHEYETKGAAGYFAYFGAAAGDPATGYYSFDVGSSWHVVALNSNCAVVPCGAGSVQERWLRADLAASNRRCTLAYWHHPRFTSGAGHGDDPAVGPLFRALHDHGVELLLSGHEHTYERFHPQSPEGAADPSGVRQFVVGTGGRGFHHVASPPRANSAVRISGTFGVLELVLGDGTYTWRFLREGGTVADRGAGRCG